MAVLLERRPKSLDLIDDLVSLISIPMLATRNLLHVVRSVDDNLASMKVFFKAYYQDKEYDRPSLFEKKVSFWDRFSHYILANEIEDKPEGMSDEDFLFEVKFGEYGQAAKDELMSWTD